MLVTGASGFAGSVVVPVLSKAGFEVHVTSRQKMTPAGVRHFVAADLASSRPEDLLEGMDAVVHLAARAHVIGDRSKDLDATYSAANAEFTQRLAIAAHQQGVSHFVFCSSVKAMGEVTRTHPLSESDIPCPADAYGRSKLEAERALKRLSDVSRMAITSLRPPLMYGAGVKGNLRRLMRMVQLGIPLPFSRISNRRSLLGVRNFGSAISSVLGSPASGFRVFLLSDGESISTPELIRKIAIAMHKQARMFSVPQELLRFAALALRKTAEFERLTGSLVVDDGAFRNEYGWTQPYSLEDGLKEMVDSFLAFHDQQRFS